MLTPKLSVLIVTYNSENHIEGLVSSLEANLGEIISEIIVIDNKSSDATVNRIVGLARAHGNIKLIQSDSNLGFRRAVNFGIRVAENEVIVVANPDTIVQDQSVTKCVEVMRDSRVAICFPRVVARRFGYKQNGSTYHLPQAVFPFILSYPFGMDEIESNEQRIFPRDTPTTAFFLIKRDCFLAINGLDEAIFMYDEEDELGLKMKELNKKIVFCPSATVIHSNAASLRTVIRRRETLVGSIYFAGPYLYRRYGDDSVPNKLMWWAIFFLRGAIASIFWRRRYPMKATVESWLRIRATIFSKTHRAKVTWNVRILFRAELWRWLLRGSTLRPRWLQSS